MSFQSFFLLLNPYIHVYGFKKDLNKKNVTEIDRTCLVIEIIQFLEMAIFRDNKKNHHLTQANYVSNSSFDWS